MPRYYLHLRTGDEIIPDEEGFDLTDLAAARCEAVRGALCIMSNDVKEGTLRLNQVIEVNDDAGQLLTRVEFSDAITIIHPEQRVAQADSTTFK